MITGTCSSAITGPRFFSALLGMISLSGYRLSSYSPGASSTFVCCLLESLIESAIPSVESTFLTVKMAAPVGDIPPRDFMTLRQDFALPQQLLVDIGEQKRDLEILPRENLVPQVSSGRPILDHQWVADHLLCLRKHRVEGLADRRSCNDTQVARLRIGNLRTCETLSVGGSAVKKE